MVAYYTYTPLLTKGQQTGDLFRLKRAPCHAFSHFVVLVKQKGGYQAHSISNMRMLTVAPASSTSASSKGTAGGSAWRGKFIYVTCSSLCTALVTPYSTFALE